VEAAEESRYFRDAAEWGLTAQVIDKIVDRWGMPDIDMFASNRNAVVPRYASWGPDPEAELIDGFSVNWRHFGSVYCFPPTPLVGKVIQKMILDKARGILVVPHWQGAIWFNMLKSITTGWFNFKITQETVYLSVNDWKQDNNCPWDHVFRVVAVNCSKR